MHNCVDDMGNFVADDELDILNCWRGYFGSQLIAHEQPIEYLDWTQN